MGASLILRTRMSLMLGYYADMLFTEHSGAFKLTVQFLFESMGYGKGPEHALVLQSIDTMNTIVSDQELLPRLEPMIGDIVQVCTELILRVKEPTFFEFIKEFCGCFSKILDDKILLIFDSIVNRMMAD